MNTVIFLDFDGVLITHRTIIANGGIPKTTDGNERRFFDETAIKLLSGIARTIKAGIVVSSTWRASPCYERMGKNLGLPIIGRLPLNTGVDNEHRGKEIKGWLARNPEITNYAILDDDTDFLEEQIPHFVQVPEKDGITWECALRLCRILNVNIWNVNKPS